MAFQHTGEKEYVGVSHFIGYSLLRKMANEGHVATGQFAHQRPALLFLFALPQQSKFNGRPVCRFANNDIHSLPSLERTGIEHRELRCSPASLRWWTEQRPFDPVVNCPGRNSKAVLDRLRHISRVPENEISLANRSCHGWPDSDFVESHHDISHQRNRKPQGAPEKQEQCIQRSLEWKKVDVDS